jgi:hypothetical protein
MSNFNLAITDRVSRVETDQENIKIQVEKHDALLDALDGKMSKLVLEVKQIRNALYVMAAAIAANVPALQKLFDALPRIF